MPSSPIMPVAAFSRRGWGGWGGCISQPIGISEKAANSLRALSALARIPRGLSRNTNSCGPTGQGGGAVAVKSAETTRVPSDAELPTRILMSEVVMPPAVVRSQPIWIKIYSLVTEKEPGLKLTFEFVVVVVDDVIVDPV